MGQDIHRPSILYASDLLDQIQAVLPDLPAIFLIFCGNLFGDTQRAFDFFLSS